MKVSEIMRRSVVVIRDCDSLEQAATVMLENELRGLPVIDVNGKICGFISVSDYLAKEKFFPFSRYSAPQLFGQWIPKERIEQIYKEARTIPVKEIMSTPALTLGEDNTVEELVDLMLRHDLSRIPVVHNGVPIGMVTRLDLLKIMTRKSTDSPREIDPEATVKSKA